jgi:RNA polymerase sigma factor (sigma-70 family)
MHTEAGQTSLRSVTSETLLQRVRDWGDEASWRQFFATYHQVVLSLATKSGLTRSESEEVAQATMIDVADRIRSFRYDRAAGSFKNWIGFQTRARIKEQWERREREQSVFRPTPMVPARDQTGTVERFPDEQSDPMLCLDRTWKETLTETALAQVREKVAPKHFQMFDLYVMKRWPLSRISRTLGVSAAQVYLTKSRVSFLLKRQTKRLQAQMDRLPTLDIQPQN